MTPTSLQAFSEAVPSSQHTLPPSHCLSKALPPPNPSVSSSRHHLQKVYGSAGFLVPTSLHAHQNIHCLSKRPLAKELGFLSML